MNEELNDELGEETTTETETKNEAEVVPSKTDIKDTKEALQLAFALVKAYKNAKSDDGNIDMLDLKHLLAVFPQMTSALEGVETIPEELKDLDESEIKELMSFSAAHLGELAGADEALVRKIEKGLKVALAIADLVKEF